MSQYRKFPILVLNWVKFPKFELSNYSSSFNAIFFFFWQNDNLYGLFVIQYTNEIFVDGN